MIVVSMKNDRSILDWIQKQAEGRKPKKSVAPAFDKVFTKTALDRGCTREQINKLLADIKENNGQA